MSLLSNSTALLGKELRTEFRSRELLTTTGVFILVVVVLFSFTFDPSSAESRRFAASLLWLAFLFAASLMLQPCFLREQNNDTLSALRLSVGDPFAIFAAKLAANTLFRQQKEERICGQLRGKNREWVAHGQAQGAQRVVILLTQEAGLQHKRRCEQERQPQETGGEPAGFRGRRVKRETE